MYACNDDRRNEEAVRELIESSVEQRIQNFREVRMQRCYEAVVAAASDIADSILIERALQARDTIPKPPRPARPPKPEVRKPEDSLLVSPFIPDTAFLPPRPDTTARND